MIEIILVCTHRISRSIVLAIKFSKFYFFILFCKILNTSSHKRMSWKKKKKKKWRKISSNFSSSFSFVHVRPRKGTIFQRWIHVFSKTRTNCEQVRVVSRTHYWRERFGKGLRKYLDFDQLAPKSFTRARQFLHSWFRVLFAGSAPMRNGRHRSCCRISSRHVSC